MTSRGGEFGDRGGWERPSWFQPKGGGIPTGLRFGKPHWFDCVAREHRAAREAVAVFDQTSFGKILVQGSDATAFLERTCAGRLDGPVGRVTYTPILNQRGGYESDVVVMRVREDAYLIITGSMQQVRDKDLLSRRIRADEFVTLSDMT